MRTLFATAGLGFCRWRRASRPWVGVASRPVRLGLDPRHRPSTVARCAAEAGFSLIEVLIASLIVSVIAVGTLTGVIAAGKSTADTRSHSQATELAGQDEERLRGFTTTQLAQLPITSTSRAENGACVEQVASAWHYWSKGSTTFCENPPGLSGAAYSGTVFTVTSSSSYVTAQTGGTKVGLTCETTGGIANYVQTTSTVTWSALGTREPVSQSSTVTLPNSYTLLVRVLNQKGEPVEGATVAVSGVTPEIQETTPSSGCVVVGGLTSATAKVAATKTGWVNKNAETTPAAKAVTLSKTATTEEKFYIAEPGNIAVEFVEAGGTHKQVSGSTFFAFQTAIETPDSFVGGSVASYSPTASLNATPIVFPFPSSGGTPPGSGPYTVFAGDCEANNPRSVTGASTEIDPKAQVEPNKTEEPTTKVELPKVTANVYEGANATSPLLASAEHAMIINKGCETAPLVRTSTGTASPPYKHEVTISGGHLLESQSFQPYATELELCVVEKKGTKYYKDKEKFSNKVAAGTTVSMYMEGTTPTGTHSNSTSPLTCP
jgi:prepilin-type N-terminal cleavage/methylation domain-containing protein